MVSVTGEELVLPLSYLIANLIDWPAKLSENKSLYGSYFRGLPRKRQIYTVLPIWFDEIYCPTIMKNEATKLKQLISRL